jgi:hypothetical protein
MPGLLHDRALRLASFGRGRRETRSQRVAGEERRIEAGVEGPTLDDQRHALIGEPRGRDLPVAVNRGNRGPSVKSAKSSQSRTARTGQVRGRPPNGMPTLRPMPSSVLDRRPLACRSVRKTSGRFQKECPSLTRGRLNQWWRGRASRLQKGVFMPDLSEVEAPLARTSLSTAPWCGQAHRLSSRAELAAKC